MLEQIMYSSVLSEFRKTEQTKDLEVYNISNLEELGAEVLYCSDLIKPNGNGFVIPYGNFNIEGLNEVHDTFKIDRYGNIYNGHTTFNEEYRINTDILRPRNNNILGK